MSRLTRRIVGLCGAVVVGCTLLTSTGAAEPRRERAVGPALELVAQTPTVASGGRFEARLAMNEIPEDGRLELLLHGRVRSRTELATSIDAIGLRGQVFNVTVAIASLPVQPDGTRVVAVSLDPAAPGGVNLTTAGVYPLEITAQDSAGTQLSTLITHLILRPSLADQSPPLAVAVLATVDAAPALEPSGALRLSDRTERGVAELANALASSEVAATLAIRPETLAALAANPTQEQEATLDRLRVAAEHRLLLALPYVAVSPDALVDAMLRDELSTSLDEGRALTSALLGVNPSSTTWLADPDLGEAGLRELRRLGVTNLVIAPEQLQPLRAGLLSLSLAQPFLLETERQTGVDVLALDAAVTQRLGTTASPGTEVSRLLAELAMLWFEQPAIPRAVIVPIDLDVRGAVVQGLLSALQAGGIFDATDVARAFSSASALRQPGGSRVDRPLRPAAPRAIPRGAASQIRAQRSVLTSFRSLFDPSHQTAADLASSHLLLAMSSVLTNSQRQAHLVATRAAMASITDAIHAPEREAITLTARDGTVPLALQNNSGVPVNVMIRLQSSKLEFPSGATLSITLTESTTRLNVPVRALASGTFPLRATITSPDGGLTLARVDYSVQSTVVSGVGLVLSIGAAVFLLVWWARHWHRTRRSKKLITGDAVAHEDEPSAST